MCVRDSLWAVDRHRGLVAGSQMATQAASRRVAALGRGGWGLPQGRARAGPAAEPRRSRAGVSLDKQRSDRGGLLLHLRGYWRMRATCCRRALIGLFSVGDVVDIFACGPACECTFAVHAIRTPSLVEIHNDGVGQFREHYRPRSAQCFARARAAELHANSPRVLARANECQFAYTHSTLKDYSSKNDL